MSLSASNGYHIALLEYLYTYPCLMGAVLFPSAISKADFQKQVNPAHLVRKYGAAIQVIAGKL